MRASIEPSPAPATEPSPIWIARREDWWLAAATFAFAAAFYGAHMAPEVTLEYSGELVTAAFILGVPHPPGYPLWTLLGFLWSHGIVPFGNPAWRIGLMSVFTGALLVGLLTLVMVRSTRLLLHALPWAHTIDEERLRWLAASVGVSTALFFGANRGVWYWAGLPEQAIQNVFCFLVAGFLFFWWIMRPQRMGALYLLLLVFGAGFVTHYTSLAMSVSLLAGVFAAGLTRYQLEPRAERPNANAGRWMRSQETFWELGVAALLSTGIIGAVLDKLYGYTYDPLFKRPEMLALFAGLILLMVGRIFRWLWITRALICAGAFLAGCAIYLYVPIASATNPPMNWGYAATREGLLHVICRGQYGRVQFASLGDPKYWINVQMLIAGLCQQYSHVLCIFGLLTLPLLAVWAIPLFRKGQSPRQRLLASTPVLPWLTFVWVAFLATTLGMLIVINPQLNRIEQQEVTKFFAPAHGFCAILIGYGLAVLFSLALRTWRNLPTMAVRAGCLFLFALPLIPYFTNRDECALETNDFGYEFGHRMFHPGGGYPDMEKNAVLFGGTDPGRFVSTYMIFCESRVPPSARFRDPAFDRADVYIITQNALADNTYMRYIRDQYDLSRPTNNTTRLQRALGRDHVYPPEPIRIPTQDDSTRAFQQFVEDWKAGRAPPGADIQLEGGRVQVTGVQAVMAINGILAKWIFDWNKEQHAFYVEESYVIPWMYPYLHPAGIIFKIENNPLPSPTENRALWDDILAKDKSYWDKLTAEFTARKDFWHNIPARRSFSKLRSAIAGLYLWRGLIPEAEYAFHQSLQLCPDSPEAAFRLADLYVSQRHYDKAHKLMTDYLQNDPNHTNVRKFIEQIDKLAQDDRRRVELQGKLEKGATADEVLELASIFTRLNMRTEMDALSTNILNNTNCPTQCLLKLAQLFSDAKRIDMAQEAFRRYTVRAPQDAQGWIELGWSQLQQNLTADALASWKKAMETGGDPARTLLRKDRRFAALWQQPGLPAKFRTLIDKPKAPSPVGGN